MKKDMTNDPSIPKAKHIGIEKMAGE